MKKILKVLSVAFLAVFIINAQNVNAKSGPEYDVDDIIDIGDLRSSLDEDNVRIIADDEYDDLYKIRVYDIDEGVYENYSTFQEDTDEYLVFDVLESTDVNNRNNNTDEFGEYNTEVEGEVKGLTDSILGVANPIIKTGGSLLIFVSVLLVGFDVILHRKDADGRTEAMSSLLWLAIGALVIGGAALFASTIWDTGQLVGKDASIDTEYRTM